MDSYILGYRRQNLTLGFKMRVLREIDKGTKKSDIAKRFSIAPSTLSTILFHRKSIKKFYDNGCLKRPRSCKSNDLDLRLYELIMKAKSMNMRVSGKIFQKLAIDESIKMGVKGFKASNGWLQKFKQRWNLTTVKKNGQQSGLDGNAEDSKNNNLKIFVAGYEPRDIFNADETTLIFNLLPDRRLLVREQTFHETKASNERLTILMCSNSNGSEKVLPLVVGRNLAPLCFNDCEDLPCVYKSNKNLLITQSVFITWLKDLDSTMKINNRKILLFLDRLAAHDCDCIVLENVKIVLIPPKLTDHVVTTDLGLIAQVKNVYRYHVTRVLVFQMNMRPEPIKKLNILRAMRRIAEAWASIRSVSLEKCFLKAGFLTGTENIPNYVNNVPVVLEDNLDDEGETIESEFC